MSLSVNNYSVSIPVSLQADRIQQAVTELNDLKEKKSGTPAPSAGEEILSSGSSPISYFSQNDLIFETLRSFIEQKFRIIEEIRNAMRPTPEELEELEEAEAEEEMEELEAKVQEVQDEVEAILEQLDSLMALMATPTADMAARSNMISAQLRSIVSKLSKLGLEVGRAISNLNQQDTSGLAPSNMENLVNKLAQLDEAISSIIDACSETADQVATA